MHNFEYFTPTRVIFGKEAEKETGRLVKEQNCKKVLLHYGGNSAKKSGLLDRVRRSLEGEGIEYTMLGTAWRSRSQSPSFPCERRN